VSDDGRGVKVDVRARLRFSTPQNLHERRREAWRVARRAELDEPIAPSDWQDWDAQLLLEGLELARPLGPIARADMLAAALARAELRGERRVRLDIEMERSSVRSEKP
jgi:hypothetical protein